MLVPFLVSFWKDLAPYTTEKGMEESQKQPSLLCDNHWVFMETIQGLCVTPTNAAAPLSFLGPRGSPLGAHSDVFYGEGNTAIWPSQSERSKFIGEMFPASGMEQQQTGMMYCAVMKYIGFLCPHK